MQNTVALFVSVPVASFRVPRAREYFETLPCPPPSTVYGMLLSLVGETNRHAHEGAELAIALVSQPDYSVVLRTMWRVKNTGKIPGLGDQTYGPGQNPEDFGAKDNRGGNRRPDFQELLTNVKALVWVRQGAAETAATSLAARVHEAITQPQSVSRFGGLSLGESTHLVDELRLAREDDVSAGRALLNDEAGELSLPVWPDHVGSRKTSWRQFSLHETVIGLTPDERSWVPIRRHAYLA